MRLQRRSCYLADATGPLVPQAIPLEWLEGARVEIPWQARQGNNAPRDLTGALAVLLHFRYSEKDTAPFLTLEGKITDALTGLFEFVVFPSHVALLKRGYYLAEITIQQTAGNFDPLVLASRVQVRAFDSSSGALSLLPVYFGQAAIPGTVDQSFVVSLGGIADAASRFRIVAYNQGAAEYGWYAYPAPFGGTSDDFFDVDTDFEAGVQLAATINITGADLVVRQYLVWRTDVAGLGAWNMEAR